MAYLQPGCGIAWWALAGIGFAESGQGTDGGTQVRADGSLTRRIVGIPLNGAPGVAAIGDTDGGLLDGDPTVDRAVGPMQFIPSTWARWGVDADGDGVADPQSFYDAAATSAAYLCQSGPMRDDAGLQRGYLSYNASLPYVALVLGKARQYAAAVQVPGR
ncbi:MAG: lytic murein transglycosylase [Actinobacteria bacterium]|nr:lytic murein transglycosylase [Actinomycetota bacterium]